MSNAAPSNFKSPFKNLGTGVGLRPFYYDHFVDTHPPKIVQWVEVITENFLPWDPAQDANLRTRPLQNLLKVRDRLPVALHGVSLSLGSADPLNMLYLDRWKHLIDVVEPCWVSDHLSWSSYQGEYLHDLLPLPYTNEVIDHVVERISRVQDFLRRPLMIEHVSTYVEWMANRMPEWEFVRQVVERSGCGLLLDVNNIYVSATNHGFDPWTYLEHLPRQSVGQIHLAGHTTRKDGILIDTHDHPICDEVWRLYARTCRHFGAVSTMIERDGQFPDWNDLEAELRTMEQIRNENTIQDSTAQAMPTALS